MEIPGPHDPAPYRANHAHHHGATADFLGTVVAGRGQSRPERGLTGYRLNNGHLPAKLFELGGQYACEGFPLISDL